MKTLPDVMAAVGTAIFWFVVVAFVLFLAVLLYSLAKIAKTSDKALSGAVYPVPVPSPAPNPICAGHAVFCPRYSLGETVSCVWEGSGTVYMVDGVDCSGDLVFYHLSPQDNNGCPGWFQEDSLAGHG